MPGELLLHLFFLALMLAFILRGSVRSGAGGRAPGLAFALQRSKRIAPSTCSRRCRSCASATVTPAEHTAQVEGRALHELERSAFPVVPHQARARATVLPPAPEETPYGES
jgi:hypothetical protein